MYHLDPFRYFMEGVITTALNPVTIVCTNDDFLRFRAPENVSCREYLFAIHFLFFYFFLYSAISIVFDNQSYTNAFFNPPAGIPPAPGYINNPDAVNTLCEYCSFRSGKEFLNTLEWDISYRWRDFGILIGYLVFNVLLSVIFVWVFRKQWR